MIKSMSDLFMDKWHDLYNIHATQCMSVHLAEVPSNQYFAST